MAKVRGEEIGVVFGASIFAPRKVPIQAADHMEQEYGLTTAEADGAGDSGRGNRQVENPTGAHPLSEFKAAGCDQSGPRSRMRG